jgi:hypothetical protein
VPNLLPGYDTDRSWEQVPYANSDPRLASWRNPKWTSVGKVTLHAQRHNDLMLTQTLTPSVGRRMVQML